MFLGVIQGRFIHGQPVGSALLRAPAGPSTGPLRPTTAQLAGERGVQRPSGSTQPVPLGGRRSATVQAWPVDPSRIGPRGPGQPLPSDLRGRMERAFSADFSQVRVHVGPQASAIGALAFTSGSDIFFAPGRYLPETTEGARLVGHELAHVVQQREGRVRNPQGVGVAIVHDRTLEAEADRMAQRAAILMPLGGACGAGSCSCRSVTSRRVAPPAAVSVPIGGRPANGQGSACDRQREVVQAASVVIHTGVRWSGKYPVRKSTLKSRGFEKLRSKRKRAEISEVIGDVEEPKKKKRKTTCGYGTTPRAGGWRRTLWDGRSRLAWTPASLLVAVGPCANPTNAALCAGMAAHIDHIIPYREHISNNANTQIFCDEICHFHGVSHADAHTWYNDINNLQGLCAHCNSVKAAADRARPGNVDQAPDPAGACPSGDCGNHGCTADVCL